MEEKIILVFGKIIDIIVVALFLAYTVFFYGVAGLYLANIDELWFGIKPVLMVAITVACLVFLLVVCAGILIKKVSVRAYYLYRNVIFGASFAFYIQGNFFKSSYGRVVLDGSSIDWSLYQRETIINTVFWCVCLFAPIVISVLVKKETIIRKIIVVVAAFLTAIQIPAFLVQACGYHSNTSSDVTITSDGVFEFSEKENVIVFLMDTMDEEYFESYLERHPEATNGLEGFKGYRNAMTCGARTKEALPLLFTGIPFLREENYSEYVGRIWKENNVLSELNKAGYAVGVYTEPDFFSTDACKYVDNFSNTKQNVGSYSILTEKLYKLTLFRFVPMILKPYFWIATEEFEEAKDKYNLFPANDDVSFYHNLKEKRMSVLSDCDRAFRFYLIRGAHEPYTMNENAEKDNKATLEAQVDGSFKIFREYLQQLKDIGIYDNTTIVVSADHGDLDKAQHVMFLCKPSGAVGEYMWSNAPVSLFDLTYYLYSKAGNKHLADAQPYGCMFTDLEEDEIRERYFYLNVTGTNQRVEEYRTFSDASNYDAMELIKEYDYNLDPNEPYVLGTELTFGMDATANRYCLEGFDGTTGWRTFVWGPYASMKIPIKEMPSSGDLEISFEGKPANGDIDVCIIVNGIDAFYRTVKKDEDSINFSIPVEQLGQDQVDIKFVFPEVDENEMELDLRDRSQDFIFYKMKMTVK